ncbi:MAG: hypothetical protein IKT27_03635 [Clostridia bacterium]|nr:hypothetical protein [Clostridia bacterium]
MDKHKCCYWCKHRFKKNREKWCGSEPHQIGYCCDNFEWCSTIKSLKPNRK